MTRIPVKTQAWLWWLNLIVQPALMGMFALMFMDPESGVGMKAFAVAFGLFAVVLFGFALVVISRTIGRTYEIVIDETSVTIPNILRGSADAIPIAAIERAAITETATTATSFFQLALTVRDRKPVLVMSQMIGPDAFHALCDALRARGIAIA